MPVFEAGLEPSCLDDGLDWRDGGRIMLSGAWLEPGLEPVPERAGGPIGLSGLKKLDLRRLSSGDCGTGMDANVSCTLSVRVFCEPGGGGALIGSGSSKEVRRFGSGASMCCVDAGLTVGFLNTSWLGCLLREEAVGCCGRVVGFLKTSWLALERRAGCCEPRTLLRLEDELLPNGSLDG